MNSGSNLIFLISQPRAGSTLLQRILGGHPEIHTVSEPWIALHPLSALRAHGVSTDYCHWLARTATTDFLSELPDGERTYVEAVRLMLTHLYGAALAVSGKKLFLDKTPRYYAIIPELRRVFPEARFIYLIRNPLAVFSSIMQTWVKGPAFSERYALRNDLVHDLLTAPTALIDAIATPGKLDAVIHYENLAASPASNIARLCQQLQLEFHAGMIEYGEKLPHWKFGDQETVYAEQRPVSDRAERWQQILRNKPAWNELARAYLRALGPGVIHRLGYNFDGLCSSLGMPEERRDFPDLLKTAILTPSYGEDRDYVSQAKYFENLIRRFAAVPALLRASGE